MDVPLRDAWMSGYGTPARPVTGHPRQLILNWIRWRALTGVLQVDRRAAGRLRGHRAPPTGSGRDPGRSRVNLIGVMRHCRRSPAPVPVTRVHAAERGCMPQARAVHAAGNGGACRRQRRCMPQATAVHAAGNGGACRRQRRCMPQATAVHAAGNGGACRRQSSVSRPPWRPRPGVVLSRARPRRGAGRQAVRGTGPARRRRIARRLCAGR